MPDGPSVRSTAPNPKGNARLNSWKEIASYLGRGVRTVQRWEETDGLPVHRLLHAKGATVYALTTELDQWWNSRRDNLVELPDSPIEPAWESVQSKPKPFQAERALEPGRRRKWVGVGSIALLIFAGAGFLLSRGSQPTVIHIKGRPFTTWPGYEVTPSFSPDGETIAFASRAIYLQRIGSDQATRLTHSERPEIEPIWSPDGLQIAFFRQESPQNLGIYVMPASGGSERRVDGIRATLAAARMDWSPDGKLIATSDRNGNGAQQLVLISPATNARQWLADTKTGDDWAPEFSPDGSTIAFVRAIAEGAQDLYLMTVHASTKGLSAQASRRLTFDSRAIYGHTWSPDGGSILAAWRRSGTFELWRIPVVGGRPVLVSGTEPGPSQPVFSRKLNRMAYVSRFSNISIWASPLDGHTPPRNLISSSMSETDPQYSPDGGRIAFRSSRTGFGNLWVANADGDGAFRITDLLGQTVGPPRWSPDGRSLAYAVGSEGRWSIHVTEARSGATSRILEAPQSSSDMLPTWSHNGRFLYFGSDRSGTWELWKQPTSGGQALQLTRQGGFNAQESVDGKSIYYSKGASIPGIWKLPGEELVLTSVSAPKWGWSPGDHGIYYVEADDADQPAEIRYFDFERRATRIVARTSGKPALGGTCISLTPDERWIAWAQVDRAGSDIILVERFK